MPGDPSPNNNQPRHIFYLAITMGPITICPHPVTRTARVVAWIPRKLSLHHPIQPYGQQISQSKEEKLDAENIIIKGDGRSGCVRSCIKFLKIFFYIKIYLNYFLIFFYF